MKKFTSILLLMILSLPLFSQTKTGTLKVFSELTGITVYLDDNKQGVDVKEINGVPIGSHYLKVLLGTVSVYGDLVEIKEGQTTTVLIKNTGQVQEKVMEAKTPQRQEYQNKKVDIILTSDAISTTTGKSSYYPGFYGYYGYNKSNTVTTNVTDFKIIQGGVKEISELSLATLAENQEILGRNVRDNAKVTKMTNTGAIIFCGSLVVGGTLFADMLVKKPFLHKVGTTAGTPEIVVASICILTGTISYCMIMGADKIKPKHYYSADVAASDAQKVNTVLKQKLGLPNSYDVK